MQELHKERAGGQSQAPRMDGTLGLLALRIRNLIAAREFNTAEANRELSLGGWLSDHRHEDNLIAGEIDLLIAKANNQ